MAVAQPRRINLAPAFANIQSGLARRAELEAEKIRNKPINVVARDVKAVFDRVFEAQLTNFISTLGKDKFTSKDADTLIKETEASGKARSIIRNHVGTRSSPKEREDFMNRFQDQLSIDLHKKGLLDTRSFSDQRKDLIGLSKPDDIPALFKQFNAEDLQKQQQEAGAQAVPGQAKLGAAFPEKAATAAFREQKPVAPAKQTPEEKVRLDIAQKVVTSFIADPASVSVEQAQEAVALLGGSIKETKPAEPGGFFSADKAAEFVVSLNKKPGDRFTDEELIRIKSEITGGEDRKLTKEEKDQFLEVAKKLGIDVSLNK